MIVDKIGKIQTIGPTELLRPIHLKKNVSIAYPFDTCHGFLQNSSYTHAAFGVRLKYDLVFMTSP